MFGNFCQFDDLSKTLFLKMMCFNKTSSLHSILDGLVSCVIVSSLCFLDNSSLKADFLVSLHSFSVMFGS